MTRPPQLNEAAIEAYLHDPEGDVAHEMERRTINVESTAKRLVMMHGTGRWYTTRFWTDPEGRLRIGGSRPPHQASSPGMPPATDTGFLIANIGHQMTGTTGVVYSGAYYSRWLEHGTSKMAARPYLRPALLAVAEPTT